MSSLISLIRHSILAMFSHPVKSLPRSNPSVNRLTLFPLQQELIYSLVICDALEGYKPSYQRDLKYFVLPSLNLS